MTLDVESRRKLLIATLERNIQQPTCLCSVQWTWRFPSGDAILPAGVDISKVRLCKQHADNKQHATELTQLYRERLTDRLEDARKRETHRMG